MPLQAQHNVAQVIASHDNICKNLHMPAQSGSSRVLSQMKRGYTREAYDALIERVRAFMPQVSGSGFAMVAHINSVLLMLCMHNFLFAFEREKLCLIAADCLVDGYNSGVLWRRGRGPPADVGSSAQCWL